MPIDRKVFFDEARAQFGRFDQNKVNGMDAILNEWERRKLSDLRWLAYIFATVWHETGQEMLPVEEIGKGSGHSYGNPDAETGQRYYGRGLPQLTHKRNYRLFSDRLGIDLVHNPDLALQLDISVKILFDGMINGLFTGVGLTRYFNTDTDWVNARRIINGTDRAEMIGRYAEKFYDALTAADYVKTAPTTPQIPEEPKQEQASVETVSVQPAPLPVTVKKTSWFEGKKTHIGMLISGGIGVAAMFGYIPGMTADQGADMLQTAFGVSGFRSAIPHLLKLAITTYMEKKQ